MKIPPSVMMKKPRILFLYSFYKNTKIPSFLAKFLKGLADLLYFISNI